MLPRNWSITQLSAGTALALNVTMPNGTVVTFAVAQFTTSYAVNEIPVAQCLLAVGLDVRTLQAATIHNQATNMRQMLKVQVVFTPKGEYLPDVPWPTPFTVFDGYFMGLGVVKLDGKVQVVANLKHWLVDLASSSTLTRNSHPLNYSQLTSRAVMQALNRFTAQPMNLSELPGVHLINADIIVDLWGGIKKLFCALANIPAAVGSSELAPCGTAGSCGQPATNGAPNQPSLGVVNDRAQRALARIEGPAALGQPGAIGAVVGGLASIAPKADCSLAYTYGVPLPLDLGGISEANFAVAEAITLTTIDNVANTTMWSKLLDYCSQFQMAIVPAVSFALVTADLPIYNGSTWIALDNSDYDGFQGQMDLDRPLRAVGVTTSAVNDYGVVAGSGSLPPPTPVVGGCYGSTNDADLNDGLIWYIDAPPWIKAIPPATLQDPGGNSSQAPQRTDTTPDSVGGPVNGQTSNQIAANVAALCCRYAQSVFAKETLRGRYAILSGKLRFDIAPGSMVEITGNDETFPGLTGDSLGVDQVGYVSRVSILINAENHQASTTFLLSHVRTKAENTEDRTSMAAHPLFGENAFHGLPGRRPGAPLVAGHETLEEMAFQDEEGGDD